MTSYIGVMNENNDKYYLTEMEKEYIFHKSMSTDNKNKYIMGMLYPTIVTDQMIMYASIMKNKLNHVYGLKSKVPYIDCNNVIDMGRGCTEPILFKYYEINNNGLAERKIKRICIKKYKNKRVDTYGKM